MVRALIHPILCLSLAVVAAACNGDREARTAERQQGAPVAADRDREQVQVTGCLTANRETNQFVLTANSTALTSLTNRAAAGEAETFHYQLVGGNDLPSYVGKEVTVTGSVTGDGKDVNLESKDKKVREPKRSDDITSAVESREEIEMQVEQLHVASIAPTGAPCRIASGR